MNNKIEIKKEVYSYLRNISLIILIIGTTLFLYLGVLKEEILIFLGISFYPLLVTIILIPVISLLLLIYSIIKLKKIKKMVIKNEI